MFEMIKNHGWVISIRRRGGPGPPRRPPATRKQWSKFESAWIERPQFVEQMPL